MFGSVALSLLQCCLMVQYCFLDLCSQRISQGQMTWCACQSPITCTDETNFCWRHQHVCRPIVLKATSNSPAPAYASAWLNQQLALALPLVKHVRQLCPPIPKRIIHIMNTSLKQCKVQACNLRVDSSRQNETY